MLLLILLIIVIIVITIIIVLTTLPTQKKTLKVSLRKSKDKLLFKRVVSKTRDRWNLALLVSFTT